jgi:hypothetical protein
MAGILAPVLRVKTFLVHWESEEDIVDSSARNLCVGFEATILFINWYEENLKDEEEDTRGVLNQRQAEDGIRFDIFLLYAKVGRMLAAGPRWRGKKPLQVSGHLTPSISACHLPVEAMMTIDNLRFPHFAAWQQ